MQSVGSAGSIDARLTRGAVALRTAVGLYFVVGLTEALRCAQVSDLLAVAILHVRTDAFVGGGAWATADTIKALASGGAVSVAAAERPTAGVGLAHALVRTVCAGAAVRSRSAAREARRVEAPTTSATLCVAGALAR